FIPCSCEREATFLSDLLNSDLVKRFLHSLVFLDAKRPITIDVLGRINLKRVAEKLGLESDARKYLRDAGLFERQQGVLVFEKEEKYRPRNLGGDTSHAVVDASR
ncbi:MAG: hypothetical protein V2A74_00050, partial [bacterium]